MRNLAISSLLSVLKGIEIVTLKYTKFMKTTNNCFVLIQIRKYLCVYIQQQ